MKKISLNGPAARNNGDFADAGDIVEVGGGKTQIDAERAKQLVDRGAAEVEPVSRPDRGEKADA